MNYSIENTASDFLELASEQRLEIILRLVEKKSRVSEIAKEIKATVQEVYRNFERLKKAELIFKDSDGDYALTTYGKTVCTLIPSITFVAQNRKYFRNHDFGGIPTKFILRIGSLSSCEHIKGFVKVFEKWANLYKNSNEYIFNVLSEVPYTSDIIEPLIAKLKNNVKVNSVFSQSAILPEERKKVLEKTDFKKFIEKGLLERRITKNVNVSIVLNEKEACIMFPSSDGEADLREMFHSSDDLFHDWCLDYFKYCWLNSVAFQETKLKEN